MNDYFWTSFAAGFFGCIPGVSLAYYFGYRLGRRSKGQR